MNLSSKPYLIRAIYEWLVDEGLTPYLAVDAKQPGVVVPQEYVRNGCIVLNVAAHVVNKLILGNEFIEFQARFSGVVKSLSIPVVAVTAMTSKESSQGITFLEGGVQLIMPTPGLIRNHREEDNQSGDETGGGSKGSGGKSDHLRIIK